MHNLPFAERPFMQNNLIKLRLHLTNALGKKLPGYLAHNKMASYKRPSPKEIDKKQLGAREAGVLIALFFHHNELCCSLIQRPDYDGTHSGQVAFPGGKTEKEDANIVATALREAEEEVGITPNSVEILGQISDIYIPPSNFVVYPVIGIIEKAPKYIIDPIEVKEAFHFPISTLFNEDAFSVKRIYLPYYKSYINAPIYEYKGKTIWGATAMMLAELGEIIKDWFEPNHQ